MNTDPENSDVVVEVKNVSMRFNLSKEKVDNLKEYVVKALKHQLLFDEFYALRNVSFSVRRGEPFAIIGENGCGKSTILKVISGIFYPTKGSVSVQGRIAPLIELGAGFDMDLTARENIYLNGAVLGYDTAFMDSKFEEIIDFSELQEFVDVPVKNFSSGMVARLGFAIATVVVPDILIVDETLSVGDFMFQQKCEKKMQEMIDNGATLIFVSHSSDQVKRLCKKAVWLKHGVVQMIGDAGTVTDAYIHDMETGGHGLVAPSDPTVPEEPEAPPVKEAAPPRKQYHFLNFLRVLALGMILWDHLGLLRNPDWRVGKFVENNINRPLGIIQYFGAFGVVLFFLISGFLAASGGGGRFRFLWRKFLKIYPPLLVSFASFYGFQWLLSQVMGPNWWSQFSLSQWLSNATLWSYITGEPSQINGTVWYLFPTLLFYLLIFLVYPWMRKRPRLSAGIMEAILAGGFLAQSFGVLPSGVLTNIVSLSWYVCIPIFGVLLYQVWERKIDFASFLLFGGINYLLMVKGMVLFQPHFYEESPYLISFAYAFLLFALAMVLEDRFKSQVIVDHLSKISYSVYLVHMTYGGLLMEILTAHIGFTISFAITIIVVLLIAAIHYWAIERPLAKFLHRAKA